MKAIKVATTLALLTTGFSQSYAGEYRIYADSNIRIIKEESTALTPVHQFDLSVPDFTLYMRKQGYQFTGGTFEYKTKTMDQGGWLRVANGKAIVEETSAYPWQGVGMTADVTLVLDLVDNATYYMSLFATAKVKPAYGDSRSSAGVSYVKVSASCSGFAGVTNQGNGPAFTGRTPDGGWLPQDKVPFEIINAGFRSSEFVFTKAHCPDGRIQVKVISEGKRIEFHGIEAAIAEVF